VDDIRPYLGQSAVCIVLLCVGSGARLKIFEAMGIGKAIISTTIGAEGCQCDAALSFCSLTHLMILRKAWQRC
jgi:hypothetical protein